MGLCFEPQANRKISLKRKIQNVIASPNKEAIWIFGLQKSGTSAIAGLLGMHAGIHVTIDTKYLWEPYRTKIHRGELSIQEIAEKYSHPFSRQIIKEPTATFFTDKVGEYFTLDPYVFIVRNPFQNIRSILNRLNLPGNKRNIGPSSIHPKWRYLFGENPGEDYVQELVNIWLKANDQQAFMESSSCLLIRYEDFMKSKKSFIMDLSQRLGLPDRFDISDKLDKQYQPKGNREVNLLEFFGERNYALIESHCREVMNRLGY